MSTINITDIIRFPHPLTPGEHLTGRVECFFKKRPATELTLNDEELNAIEDIKEQRLAKLTRKLLRSHQQELKEQGKPHTAVFDMIPCYLHEATHAYTPKGLAELKHATFERHWKASQAQIDAANNSARPILSNHWREFQVWE